jgi:hypothetical protein
VKFILVFMMGALAFAQTYPNPEVTEMPTYESVAIRKAKAVSANPTAPLIKIAIIDTGYSIRDAAVPIKLCKEGHYNFLTSTANVGPSKQPHGSQVASIIAEALQGVNYCALIYNVDTIDGINFDSIVGAFRRAADAGAQVVNMSIQGYRYSFSERDAIMAVTARGVEVFVAAGNDNMNMDEACNSYPGCYNIPHLHMVGSILPDFSARSSFSNYGGKVELWYPGYYGDGIHSGRGTSFASPRAAADYAAALAARKR